MKLLVKKNSKVIYFLFGWLEKVECHLCAQGKCLDGVKKILQRDTLSLYLNLMPKIKDKLGGGSRGSATGSYYLSLFSV